MIRLVWVVIGAISFIALAHTADRHRLTALLAELKAKYPGETKAIIALTADLNQ